MIRAILFSRGVVSVGAPPGPRTLRSRVAAVRLVYRSEIETSIEYSDVILILPQRYIKDKYVACAWPSLPCGVPIPAPTPLCPHTDHTYVSDVNKGLLSLISML